jgi:regulator of sirC expression with transglutaminase-like and TPR domain
MRSDLLDAFARLVGAAGQPVPLIDSALACAACLQDGDTWPELESRLRELELGATRAARSSEDSLDRARALLTYVHAQGFHVPGGDERRVSDHLIDRVVETGRGSAICLSILAIHLAACAGVEVWGVAFPGAMLLGAQLDSPRPFLYDLGTDEELDLDALAERYSRAKGRDTGKDAPDLRAWIAPAHSRLLLADLLRALRRTQGRSGSQQRLADVLELESLLQPEVDSLKELAAEHLRRTRSLH